MRVGHVVNGFDPACDVLRCVRELNAHSRHEHALYVRDPHPMQYIYHYEIPGPPEWNLLSADVLIYHFANSKQGWHDDSKPAAFRNIHITWDPLTRKFWTNRDYDPGDYERFRLVSASHAGAAQYMPADKFRWLPDLLPLDGPYQFVPGARWPAVSFIKHSDVLGHRFTPGVGSINCFRMAHPHVLSVRSAIATAVVDNVCDGHYGLAGQEAAIMGLPVTVFNHDLTLEAMKGWEKPGTVFPFTQAVTVDEAWDLAVELSREPVSYRAAVRRWAEEFFDPRRLIAGYWDPFIEELAS